MGQRTNTSTPMSKRQRAILQREQRILETARVVLLEDGYFGLTMDRIAERSETPKGTLYQRFSSKEDVILALALQSHEKRRDMIQRGAAYPGRPRERMCAVGEGMALFTRLHPNDSRILHIATGSLREKAGPRRLETLLAVEREGVMLIDAILKDAIAAGDLREDSDRRQITFALWALVDGAYTLIEEGAPQTTLGMAHPIVELWLVYHRLADAYGWRPLFNEMDWEETMADVRRTIFPDESQALYGKGKWYGDRIGKEGEMPPLGLL